jgi:hypothetical protein
MRANYYWRVINGNDQELSTFGIYGCHRQRQIAGEFETFSRAPQPLAFQQLSFFFFSLFRPH